jgi:acetyl-CoA carboxylase beta subunit
VVVAGCIVFDGGRLGSATKARIPKIAARAWEGAAAAAAPKVCMTAAGGMHARVPKAGKIGDGKVVAGP